MLQLILEWEDVMKTFYSRLGSPKPHVASVIKRSLEQLTAQLGDRTKRFKGAQPSRQHLEKISEGGGM